jgi:hypothetical protein
MDIKEIIVIDRASLIPDYRKSTGCYHNGDPISGTMKKVIVVSAPFSGNI